MAEVKRVRRPQALDDLRCRKKYYGVKEKSEFPQMWELQCIAQT